MRRTLIASCTILFALVLASSLSAQRPSRPPAGGGGGAQPLCPGCGDQDPPVIWLNAPGGPVSVPNPYIEVYWCDGYTLNASSRWIKLNGVDVTSSFGYTIGGDDCVARAYSGTTSVTLNIGSNAVEAHICDNEGFCTTTTFYINRVSGGGPPTVVLRNQNGQNVDRGLCLTLGAGQSAGLSSATCSSRTACRPIGPWAATGR